MTRYNTESFDIRPQVKESIRKTRAALNIYEGKQMSPTNNDRIVHIPNDIAVSGQILDSFDPWYVTEAIKKLHSRGITGKGFKACIGDTGGTDTHPDLKPPFEMIDNTNSRSGARDIHGHGTACASIMLAVAPGLEYCSIKILSDSGSGSMNSINRSYQQAAELGCHIYNGSFGDNGGPPIQSDLIALDNGYRGGLHLINIAAGNAGFNGRNNTIGRPALYKSTGCTGATDRNNRISGFSSGGNEMDWAAFGQDMPFATPDGGYSRGSGTSFACPFTCGVWGLVYQIRRILGFKDLVGLEDHRQFMIDNEMFIDAGTPGEDPSYGIGIPDINKLISWADRHTLFMV